MRVVNLLLLCCLLPASAFSQNVFYWLPSSNQLASDPDNWRQGSCSGPSGQLPSATDTVILGACLPAQNCTLDVNWTVAKLVLNENYSATLTVDPAVSSITLWEAECLGGTFHAASAQVFIEKRLLLDGCTFIAPAETLSVKEEFTYLSGTFLHNNGTVIFKKGLGSITQLEGNASNVQELVFHKLDFFASGNFGTRFYVNHLDVRVLSDLRLVGVKPLTLASSSNARFTLEGNLINDNDQTDLDTLWFRFSGPAIQLVSGTQSTLIHRMEVNKTAGFVHLLKPLSISGEVLFTQGYIACDSANALTFLQNAVVTNSGGHGFVRGAVRKIGMGEFLFPIGDGWRYRPLKISPPKQPTDAFLAYYAFGGPPFTQKESNLTYLSKCDYWALHRTSGTSAVFVRLFYDSITCDIDSLITLRIARWNPATQMWSSTGPAHLSGTLAKGTIITTTPIQDLGFFTLAKESPLPVVDAGPDLWVCPYTQVILGGQTVASGGTPPYSFSWSPDLFLDSSDISNPRALIVSDVDYVLTVTDSDDAVVTDTIRIKVFPSLKADAGADRMVVPGATTVLGAAPKGGKAPFTYSWQPATDLSQTNVQQPVAAPKASAVYTVTVTDANGCAASDQVSVLLMPPPLDRAATFALFSADSIQSKGSLLVHGMVGSRKFVSATIRSTDSIVIRRRLDSLAHADLNAAISFINNLSGTVINPQLNGQQLSAGVYSISGKATLSGTLTFTGDHRSLFILQLNDSLVADSGATLLLDGVHKSQVILLAKKGIRVNQVAVLPAVMISEGPIQGGEIREATLLSKGPIQLDGGSFSPSVFAARPTGITRTDAADWLGLNSSTVEKASGSYQSHWASTALRRSLPLLNARILRFPPGGKSKSWNANDGWYLNAEEQYADSSLISSSKLPCLEISEVSTQEAAVLPVNRMLEFRQVLTGNNALGMYVANLFTPQSFQIEIIRHALDLNLPLKFIELGNEFYLRGQTCGFRTPADYAAVVNSYLNELHNTPGLDHLRVGIVASAFTTEDGLDTGNGCRRMTWNAELLPLLNNLKAGDAITFHLYPRCGLPNSQAPVVNLSDIPTIIQKAYTETEDFFNHEMQILNQYPQLDAWITEYNLTDPIFTIHGSWVHGLYMSLFTLRLLEMPKIKLVTAQTMANNAARGILFVDAFGYVLNEGWSTIGTQVPTQAWGLTAQGLMIKLIADAMRYSTKATLLQFNQAPLINNKYPLLYGWTFDKDLGDKQSILFNFSDKPLQVAISQLAPCSAMEQLYASDPLLFVTGHVTHPQHSGIYTGVLYDFATGLTTPAHYDSVHLQLPENCRSIVLPPYSITRLYALNQSGVWLRQSGTTVCAADPLSPVPGQASTAVNLYASGGASFEWSIGEPACPQQSSLAASPVTSSSGTLKVYDPAGNLIGQKTNIIVNVLNLPPLTVTPAAFNNADAKTSSFVATASGAQFYNWNPSYGLNAISGPSVTITPTRSGRYFVIGTGANSCSRLATIQTTVDPNVSILEFGGTLTKSVYPPTTKICKGSSVNLFADARADKVRWIAGDGTLLSEGPSFTLSATRNMLVTAEVTNSLIPATSRSSLWVEVLPTVEPEHADVFGCANTFVLLQSTIKEGGTSSLYAWDDQQPGTMLYEKKNLSKPVQENVFDSKYDPVFFYGPAGNYAVRLFAKDPNYSVCPDISNDSVVNVFISDAPAPVFASSPCVISGGTVTLTASGAANYTWMGAGLREHIGPSVTVSPQTSTTYTLIAGNNQCCTSATVEVTVEPFVALCDSSTYCHGCLKKTVYVFPYDPSQYSYQWYVNDLPVSGATGPSHTVQFLGFRNRSAIVYCAVSRLDGSCAPGRTNPVKMSLSRFCHYSRDYLPYTPDVVQNLRLYPNPADQQVTIAFHQPDAVHNACWLSVYDLLGNTLLRSWLPLEDGRAEETLKTPLPEGTYLVQVCTPDGCVAEPLVIAH
ncbi:MAG: ice-binding family protein [Chitinophagales bacterium]|nr:ice-binding family protein [Chitinophagales bacterium]